MPSLRATSFGGVCLLMTRCPLPGVPRCANCYLAPARVGAYCSQWCAQAARCKANAQYASEHVPHTPLSVLVDPLDKTKLAR